jgi:hypothetical protein
MSKRERKQSQILKAAMEAMSEYRTDSDAERKGTSLFFASREQFIFRTTVLAQFLLYFIVLFVRRLRSD